MDQIGPLGQKITLIHFVFSAEPERIACMPGMTEFHQTSHHPNYQRTNSAAAVTCPACKRTAEYKAARGISG